MNILQALYVREYLALLVIICPGLGLIFSLLDLIDKIDNFVPGGLTIGSIGYYVSLVMPKYLLYLLPMSLLLSSLFVFGLASRNRELIAVQASGGRLKRLFSPFLFMGIGASVLAFVLGEFVLPAHTERLIDFRRTYMGKTEKVTVVDGVVWLRGSDGSLVRIALYLPDARSARGLSIFYPGGNALVRRIEAEEAQWLDPAGGQGTWRLARVRAYDVMEGTVQEMPTMDYPHIAAPSVFERGIRKPEEMGIVELSRYRATLSAAGIKDPKLSVDTHVKLSYPIMNLIMMLLGLSLAPVRRGGGGLFIAGVGIFFSFLYWLLYTFTLSMGYARVVHPVVAAWAVPVLFGCLAAYLFTRIPE